MNMRTLTRLSSRTYIRYGVGSVLALGSDLALFMIMLRLGLMPVAASALGYGLGIIVHWLISSRFVFADGAASTGPARTRQKGLFLGSALIGLGITTGIMTVGTMVGLMPIVAKLIAIVISFQATYMLRKAVVFTA
jgi:putative flippase GtrA